MLLPKQPLPLFRPTKGKKIAFPQQSRWQCLWGKLDGGGKFANCAKSWNWGLQMWRNVSHLKEQVDFLLGVRKRKKKRLERSQDNLDTLRKQLTAKASWLQLRFHFRSCVMLSAQSPSNTIITASNIASILLQQLLRVILNDKWKVDELVQDKLRLLLCSLKAFDCPAWHPRPKYKHGYKELLIYLWITNRSFLLELFALLLSSSLLI